MTNRPAKEKPAKEKPPREQAEPEVVTWRPAAASFRNLLAVGGAAAVGAVAVMAFTRPALMAVGVGLGLLAGFGITAVLSARRLSAGLAEAERPALSNWPGSEDDRRRLDRAGQLRGANAAIVALILGAISGIVPAVGLAVVGAGTATGATAWYMRRAVRRYEDDHAVTVFAAHGAMQRRAPHRFGVA